jgi:hypothetical protein
VNARLGRNITLIVKSFCDVFGGNKRTTLGNHDLNGCDSIPVRVLANLPVLLHVKLKRPARPPFLLVLAQQPPESLLPAAH